MRDALVVSGFSIRWAVALVFLLAAVPKLHSPAKFALGIRQYDVLPPRAVRPVAFAIPTLELALAVVLAVGWQVRIATIAAALLLVTFAAAAIRSLRRGQRFRCHCFGAGEGHYIGVGLVARNLLVVGLLLFVGVTTGAAPDVSTLHVMSDWLALGMTVAFMYAVIYFVPFCELAFQGVLPDRPITEYWKR